MGREFVFVGLTLLAVLLLVLHLVYLAFVGLGVTSFLGRIIFGTMATLKLWAVGVLTYLVLYPVFFPGRLIKYREHIAWGFLLYLVAQASISLIAWERWRRVSPKERT